MREFDFRQSNLCLNYLSTIYNSVPPLLNARARRPIFSLVYYSRELIVCLSRQYESK